MPEMDTPHMVFDQSDDEMKLNVGAVKRRVCFQKCGSLGEWRGNNAFSTSAPAPPIPRKGERGIERQAKRVAVVASVNQYEIQMIL